MSQRDRSVSAASSFLDDRGKALNLAPEHVVRGQIAGSGSLRFWILRLWPFALIGAVLAFSLHRGGFSFNVSISDFNFLILLVPTLIAGEVIVRSVRGRQRESQSMLASFLVAHRRCGACGYDLRPTAPEQDGCVVCPECSAAWHKDRFVWEGRDPTWAGRLSEVMSKGHQYANDGECDDRGVPTPGGNRWPPRWYSDLTAGALRSRFEAQMRSRQRSIARYVWSGAALFWLGLVALLISVSEERGWGTILLVTVVTFIITALLAHVFWRVVVSFWMRRWAVDALHLCNNCGNELPASDPPAFDGCFACTKCGHAWKPRVDRHAHAGGEQALGVPAEQS